MAKSAIAAGRRLASDAPRNLGAVFTKRWVVDLLLDLAGYVPEEDLAAYTALEPAVGNGAFIEAMVERLVASCEKYDRKISEASAALIGFDLDSKAVSASRAKVAAVLRRNGVDEVTSVTLAKTWIRKGDFLLSAARLPRVRWAIGNPPYIRVEDIDPELLQEYRCRWTAMSGRADVYVGFMQAALTRLLPEGRMTFICADRWMRNRYGSNIRTIIEADFAVDACIVLHDVDAFEEVVAAYPAITVIRAGRQDNVLIADARASFSANAASELLDTFQLGPTDTHLHNEHYSASWSNGWFSDGESWPAGSPEQLAVLSQIESNFDLVEDTGVRISVGVATGADAVFVTARPGNIEPDRLVKTLGAKETATGTIVWKRRYMVNPWQGGKLISLNDFPGAAAYFRRHAGRLKKRYIAQRQPEAWWRTIDCIHDGIARTPKLLIPDLKDRVHPVYDPGEYVPMHSLYYLTSDTWDLEVLGGLLMSDTVRLFIESYSVRMANGYLRVSAQYLRRIRLPRPESISQASQSALRAAFRSRDETTASMVAKRVFGL